MITIVKNDARSTTKHAYAVAKILRCGPDFTDELTGFPCRYSTIVSMQHVFSLRHQYDKVAIVALARKEVTLLLSNLLAGEALALQDELP